MRKAMCWLALALLLAGPQVASAQTAIVYYDEASFVDDATNGQGYTLPPCNTFDTNNGFEASPLHFNVGGWTYDASTPNGFFSAPHEFSTNVAEDNITFDFPGVGAGPDTFAVGGYFWNTDINFNPVVGTIVLLLDDGSVGMVANVNGPTFVGFIQPQGCPAIAQLIFVPDNTQPYFTWATVNCFYAGG